MGKSWDEVLERKDDRRTIEDIRKLYAEMLKEQVPLDEAIESAQDESDWVDVRITELNALLGSVDQLSWILAENEVWWKDNEKGEIDKLAGTN